MTWKRARLAASAVALAAAMAAGGGCSRTPEQKRDRFLAQGKKQMERKDYTRAMLEFKNAIRAKPGDPESHYQLALAYLKAGDPKTAAALLWKTAELDPAHSGAQLKLAQFMAASGQADVVEQAEQRALGVLKKSPGDEEALNTLAVAEFRLGKTEDAERHLQEALDRFPQSLQTAVGLARVRLARKDWAGAEETLKAAAAQTPPSAPAAVALGELYLVTGRAGESEREIRRALGIEPDNPAALIDLAKLRVQAGDNAGAEAPLKRLSQLPEKRYKALYGLFLLRTGKRKEGLAELERLAREAPGDREARARLVAAYIAENRSADAEKVVTAALEKNPKDVDALLERSRFYLGAGKTQQAQADLDQALRFRGDSAEAHRLMAALHRARGASLSQRQELAEAVRLDPAMLEARLELAELLIGSGAGETALDLLEEAPEAQRRTLGWVVQRNAALIASGDLARAEKEVEAALKTAETDALLVQRAAVRLQRKDYPGAQAALEDALKRNPENLAAVDLLARTRFARKQGGTAIQRLREYAAARPKSAPVQMLFGGWLTAAGERAGARAAFEAARAANPRSAAAISAIAQIDMADGKLDAARLLLKEILSTDPANSPARTLAGAVEEAAGNRETAIAHYRRAVETDSRNVLALNNLAYLLADFANQPDEALKYAQQAKELAPESPVVDDTIGWAFYRKGIYVTAIRHLEIAARDGSPVRKYHLAMAYLKAGERKKGEQTLESALKLDPNLPEARMARSVLAESATP